MSEIRRITPYLGIIVLIVSIGGIFYPKLGYILLLVFATLLIIAPFRGRWFCGNLCPRGSFVDFWLAPLSGRLRIPAFIFIRRWNSTAALNRLFRVTIG